MPDLKNIQDVNAFRIPAATYRKIVGRGEKTGYIRVETGLRMFDMGTHACDYARRVTKTLGIDATMWSSARDVTAGGDFYGIAVLYVKPKPEEAEALLNLNIGFRWLSEPELPQKKSS